MFVWILHRISGLLLILLVGLQIASGFCQGSAADDSFVERVARLHNHPLLVCVLVGLFTFHSLYGIRTVLMDLGVRKEKALARGATVLGAVIFAAFLVFYFSVVVR